MDTVKRTERTAFQNGPKVGVVDINPSSNDLEYDNYYEDGDMAFLDSEGDVVIKKNKKTDEEVKIASLNQAINMAKLLSNVSVDDIIEIAKKVAIYIKAK